MARVIQWLVCAAVVCAPALAHAGAGVASMPPVQRPRAMMAPATAATATDAPVTAPAPAAIESAAPAPETDATPVAPSEGDPTAAPSSSTSVPAPRVDASTAPGETSVRRSARPSARKLPHHGFFVDFRFGTQGCTRQICNGSGHAAAPGMRLDGFLGGNIRGWVDFGLAGGWGTMNANVAKGTNVLSLYGVDPSLLQNALTLLAGQALGLNLPGLAVNDARLRNAQGGPMLRVHFIPRGRFAAWVGSGAQYNLFRARYDTAIGPARVDFHGIAVPIEAGFAVHVHEHVAVGAQFDYLWTWYALTNLRQGSQSFTLPVRTLDDAARMQGAAFRDQLPQFWTVGLTLRARI